MNREKLKPFTGEAEEQLEAKGLCYGASYTAMALVSPALHSLRADPACCLPGPPAQ